MDDKVTLYINAIREHLEAKHGKVKAEWEGLLEILETQYDIFLQAKENVKKFGLVTQGSRGMMPSPHIKLMNDATSQIKSIVTELGVSPKQENKIKPQDNDSDEDFLKMLTQ